MARRVARPKRDAFISHASADLAIAREIEAALQSAGLDAWLDDSEIQIGVLLAGELQGSIADCRTLILLWSAKAARSRWVNTEWIAAHMLDRFKAVVDNRHEYARDWKARTGGKVVGCFF